MTPNDTTEIIKKYSKSIIFSCDEYYGVASGRIDQKLTDKYYSSNKELLFYDFYVPDVKKIIDSYNDHIKCQLKVKVKLFVNSNSRTCLPRSS